MNIKDTWSTKDIAQQHRKIYGAVSLHMPVKNTVIIMVFSLLVGSLLLFCMMAEYVELSVVKGYLNVKSGMMRVYPLRAGIIRKRFVVAGQFVKKGDLLYVIDSSYEGLTHPPQSEYQLLRLRRDELNHTIDAKTNYLKKLKPLVQKHYLSLTAYQALNNDLSALQAHRHELTMAMMRYQQSRAETIRAPGAGQISSLEFDVGQNATPTKALLTILPQDTALVAQLYIPVAKSGFVHPQATVALRYDAYPYQQFGVATGHIDTITQSILSDREEEKPIDIGEPYYKALVTLDQQSLGLHPLHQGMTCTAVIAGAHKKLWRWILDPVHHYTEGFF